MRSLFLTMMSVDPYQPVLINAVGNIEYINPIAFAFRIGIQPHDVTKALIKTKSPKKVARVKGW